MDFTSFTVVGRLTGDPELITSTKGNPICRFRVATNKRINKDEERTSFINVVVLDSRTAELCSEFLSKGREVRAQGEFETDDYVDKDGNKRTGFSLVVGRDGGVIQFGSGGTRNSDSEEETPRSERGVTREKTTSVIREKIQDRGGSIRGQTRRR